MTVYLLAPEDTAYDVNRHVARLGFLARGEEVVMFERGGFDALPLTVDDIVVGGVGFAQAAFERLGWTVVDLPSVPDALSKYAGRRTWCGTIGDVRRLVSAKEPVFFKPIPSQTKRFTGIAAKSVSDLIETAALPDDLEVDCADVVDFRAEFRTFILHGEIIGVRHYKGDPLLFPDADRIREASQAWGDAPAAWALDVGVIASGETLVVEVNDGYAIGAYGLPPLRYAAMIDARWAELRAAA